MGTGSGTTTLAWGSDLNIGTTYSISARYDVIAGTANDTGQLFVNGSPYVAMTTTGTDASTFSALAIRQGGATTSPIVTLDNLSVEVLAIPEPATGLVLGLGFVGMLVRRRR